MAPQRHQHLLPQAAQAFHPGTLGQRAQNLRRQVLIPAPHPTQFRRRAAAKKRRKHEAKDFSQQFLLAAQASFDLLDQVVGQTQGMQRLFERLNGSLGPLLIMPQPLVGCVPAALSGFGLCFWLLVRVMVYPSTVVVTLERVEVTMTCKSYDFKCFHATSGANPPRWSP